MKLALQGKSPVQGFEIGEYILWKYEEETHVLGLSD